MLHGRADGLGEQLEITVGFEDCFEDGFKIALKIGSR